MKPFMYAWVNKDGDVFDFSQSRDWAQEKIDRLNELGQAGPDSYKIIPMFPGTPNSVGDQPNYKFKFETLVEHAKQQDQSLAYFRSRENYFMQYSDDDVWHWFSQEQNRIDSLTCPIVISPLDLRSIIKGAKPDQDGWVSLASYNNLNESYIRLEDKYEDARHETDLLIHHILDAEPSAVRSENSEHINLPKAEECLQARLAKLKLKNEPALQNFFCNVDKLLTMLATDSSPGAGCVSQDILLLIRQSLEEAKNGN